MNSFSSAVRIGIFYDGNFFFHVSNYYQYHHERRQRLSVGGLHAFIRSEVSRLEDVDPRHCPIAEAHYFRGRLRASEADDRDLLFRERVFDDVLIREGVTAHYLPLSRDGERGVGVALSLEAYELAAEHRFDVAVVLGCDGDYLTLVRKLAARGVRVMVLGWDFRYHDANGFERETRTAQVLIDEATYPIDMVQTIEGRNDVMVNGLFVPRRDLDRPVYDRHEHRTERHERPERTEYRAERHDRPERPAAAALPMEDMQGLELVGTISAVKNGYGFITPSLGGENIFFFHADVIDTDFLSLKLGDKVEYISTTNERGPCAKNVRVVA
ncbi:MAG: NYN domain-containing protein [Gemmataceae bacterium]|nr:NYN domain-containing protein [Gemmataceae bacterium]